MAKYICNGATCKCSSGTKDGALKVESQSKIFIQNKLMATENEKTFLENFGECNSKSPSIPCVPNILTPWSSPKSNVLQNKHKGLLEASTVMCANLGKINILDSKQSQTKNVKLGDYSSEPKEISKVYAKVRTLESYKGEFGFDWIDVHPETMDIEKIQGIPFENVEYFYKKGKSPQELGNIIAKSTDEAGAIQAVQENYGLINFCNHVDIPFVLLKPIQEITLDLEVFFEGESQDDYISITGDEFYDFKIVGEEERKDKNDKTTKKKIVANEKLLLTIKCLKESLDKTYYFLHSGINGPREVGGLSLIENKVLKLKFRVIALVSNEGNPNTKAKALFEKFRDNGITKHLDENSLNQAGYKIEIENEEMFDNLENPSLNLDDYLYAFDKEDWTNKNYYNAGMLFKNIKVDTGKKDPEGNPITVTKHIDFVTIEEYIKKLKRKNKLYSGGLIILTDSRSMGTTGAFSRFNPFNHYALFVYATNIGSKQTYSHEIGHMLGLNHTFYLGDEGFKEKWNELENSKNDILKIQNNASPIFGNSEITTKRSLILDALNKTNAVFRNDIRKRKIEYNKTKNSTGNFIWDKKPVSKKVFLEKSLAAITEKENQEKSNTQAIKEFSLKKDTIYIDYTKIDNSTFFILKENYLSIKKDYLKYYSFFLTKNYLLYKKGSTKNMMDYSSNQERIQFHQIKIMRDDYEYY
ncbi:PAAR-like protein [Flavobacterium sp. Fl-318]|uniref:PAAR-like protein n=1 Tax=Flavobacterium cupriresistens TaxID=2893885 RepID=A0ABU4RFA8_9FLAO|nr:MULTISPECIES: DUF4280 domain-containing protein [unclassified Flavobacterium]MDX6191294.1 PAAR-like protein [Flavobacterium sp. Fl-318]UFH42388.1 DUF4280 domain-containing protein [Flavobacterium sp. F-323]